MTESKREDSNRTAARLSIALALISLVSAVVVAIVSRPDPLAPIYAQATIDRAATQVARTEGALFSTQTIEATYSLAPTNMIAIPMPSELPSTATVETTPLAVTTSAAPTITHILQTVASEPSPQFPCEAVVQSTGSDAYAIRGAVFPRPDKRALPLSVVLEVDQVLLLSQRRRTGSEDWFQIVTTEGGIIGWVEQQSIVLSPNCPV